MSNYFEALLVAFLAASSCGRINPFNIIFNILLLIVAYLLLLLVFFPIKILLNKFKQKTGRTWYLIFVLVIEVLLIAIISWLAGFRIFPVGILPFDCL